MYASTWEKGEVQLTTSLCIYIFSEIESTQTSSVGIGWSVNCAINYFRRILQKLIFSFLIKAGTISGTEALFGLRASNLVKSECSVTVLGENPKGKILHK